PPDGLPRGARQGTAAVRRREPDEPQADRVAAGRTRRGDDPHVRTGALATFPAMSHPEPYYRPDLARIHHVGFGFHADDCAPGILALLEPVLERRGLVVEVGCGSGRLTK